eukprot:jgi/Chrzof1/9768/Cz04g15030.t1
MPHMRAQQQDKVSACWMPYICFMVSGQETVAALPVKTDASIIMNAVVIHSQGGTEVLKLETNYPVPTRSKGEVLIKLHSTSVDPVDTMVRDGTFPVQKFPKILGGNIAGEVVEADEGSKVLLGGCIAAAVLGISKFMSNEHHDIRREHRGNM